MPQTEYVLGFECDLTNVTDVAIQEAVEKFADELRHDNEHNRPLEHLRHLLGPWATKVVASVAMDGESSRYVSTLENGTITSEPSKPRFTKLRGIGIRVHNPHAKVDASIDPLVTGRTRQKLAAIEAVGRGEVTRLVQALAHPANARGTPDANDIRGRIYTRLTVFGGPEATAALIAGLASEDNGVVRPEYLVRLKSLRKELPDVLLAAWLGKRELVYRRILSIAGDLEYTDEWLAKAPDDLRVQIGRPR